jgi:hypothetical protein|tara:strand:+ start:119 stop:433 length:315 start_codon:yes stop_codon:yes gene_type:complete
LIHSLKHHESVQHLPLRSNIPPSKSHRAVVKVLAGGFSINELDPLVLVNHQFVLWSARGRAYARRFAKSASIEELFVAIIGKPTCIVDDEGKQWARLIKINTFE